MQTRVCNNNGVCSCRNDDAEKNLVCCSSISRSREEPHLSEVILETVNKAPIILMVMLNIFTVFLMLLINSLLE